MTGILKNVPKLSCRRGEWMVFPLRLMGGLSGGEKTRIFLAGMELHSPVAILLDEPTNHLDATGRQRLYDFVRRTPAIVLVISHDRTLLNQLPAICELASNGLTFYGGNYDFFKEQKGIQLNALQEQLEEKAKSPADLPRDVPSSSSAIPSSAVATTNPNGGRTRSRLSGGCSVRPTIYGYLTAVCTLTRGFHGVALSATIPDGCSYSTTRDSLQRIPNG